MEKEKKEENEIRKTTEYQFYTMIHQTYEILSSSSPPPQKKKERKN